jgi:hypothetical protein
MTSRKDLEDGSKKIETFLTHLAVDGHEAPSTQNQALNSLVFLYKKVLNDLHPRLAAGRAESFG